MIFEDETKTVIKKFFSVWCEKSNLDHVDISYLYISVVQLYFEQKQRLEEVIEEYTNINIDDNSLQIICSFLFLDNKITWERIMIFLLFLGEMIKLNKITISHSVEYFGNFLNSSDWFREKNGWKGLI